MDIAQSLTTTPNTIKCIEMHTTGEPTRIIYAGFPPLTGPTLLSQRAHAEKEYDHIRKRIMLEPRGHYDMYGAILIQNTELVRSGEAHIGVLFTHNGGISTMCGHATISLGRFLVDTRDENVFPKRGELVLDEESLTVGVRLHAPCGVVDVTVPVMQSADGMKSDPARNVAFISTPAYAAAVGVRVSVPEEVRWGELGGRKSITVDVSYGGAFFALVDVRELGFKEGLKKVDLERMTQVVGKLKGYLETHPDIVRACQHPEDERLSFLYSVMVVDSQVGVNPGGVDGVETGLCFFADDEIDRSPTGSCVTARMALAYAKGERAVGQRWAYHSVVSSHFQTGAFVGEIVETGLRIEGENGPARDAVVVRVEGSAYYTGASSFVVEEGDVTGHAGFTMKSVTQ
ncbi:putative proline racemase [Aspergillus ibericus CBS 121593]|uniref:trans-L-3-hydroxyproline dehydratase n=1 Tax=Aspergillus ibericus CBS 121593 TaxID=1448316 RepID=A0A395GUT0_9EURO|nr:Diaminopimelate epimerase-like protein [Aspergillus ibericus CBS 121593]RAK99321.1 Diaminopimelate epimerase-like protein [Aspergillus ibericus CBS 121593]